MDFELSDRAKDFRERLLAFMDEYGMHDLRALAQVVRVDLGIALAYNVLTVGFALAGFGGVVAAPITTVDFRGGVDLLPVCFIAVIVGGLGNLPGTAAAAILLSLLEGIVQSFANPTLARITSLLLMSAVLLLRPQGLFKGFAK